MKRQPTLEQLLEGQDLSPKKTAAQVLNDETIDSLTQVIVNAWGHRGGQSNSFEMEEYLCDLKYAQDQIEKAIKTAQKYVPK